MLTPDLRLPSGAAPNFGAGLETPASKDEMTSSCNGDSAYSEFLFGSLSYSTFLGFLSLDFVH